MNLLDILPLITLFGMVLGVLLIYSIRKYHKDFGLEMISIIMTTLFGLIGVLNTMIIDCRYKEESLHNIIIIFVLFLLIISAYTFYKYKKESKQKILKGGH